MAKNIRLPLFILVVAIAALLSSYDAEAISVEITQPPEGAEFDEGQTVAITATISNPSNYEITRIDFHATNTVTQSTLLINSVDNPTGSTVTTSWTNVPAGSYDLTATVTYEGDEEEASITLNMDAGWNMVSMNIVPDEPNMEAIFAPIIGDVVIISNRYGDLFWPAIDGENQIGDWDYRRAYHVYLSNPASLTITGTPIPQQGMDVPLPQGWNTLAYLRQSPQDAETILAGIMDDLVIISDTKGGIFWPAIDGENQIGDMEPKQGYIIYTSSSTTLNY